MNIQLHSDDEGFIRERIAAGRFSVPSQVIHHTFEVLRKMKDKLDAERIAGLDSGDPQPLADDWKAQVRRACRMSTRLIGVGFVVHRLGRATDADDDVELIGVQLASMVRP